MQQAQAEVSAEYEERLTALREQLILVTGREQAAQMQRASAQAALDVANSALQSAQADRQRLENAIKALKTATDSSAQQLEALSRQ